MISEICIVRLSAIGDVVLSVPLVKTLQRYLPKANITWVVARQAYSLVEGLEGVNFIVIDKPRGIGDYLRFRKRMRSYRFDVLLAMQASLRANLLYPLIRARRKIGFDKARAKDFHGLFVKEQIEPCENHLLEGFLQFAQKLGVKESVVDWSLRLEESHFQWASGVLGERPFVALNPFASKGERDWPMSRYVELIDAIKRQYDVQCVITGSPEDKINCDELANETKSLSLAGRTNLKQLAAVLSLASVLIAPDTGPAHIAQAVKTPVIGLYVVAPSALSGPYLSKEYVIDKYELALKRFLNKELNQVVYGTRVHHSEAMSLIKVNEVTEKLDKINLPLNEVEVV